MGENTGPIQDPQKAVDYRDHQPEDRRDGEVELPRYDGLVTGFELTMYETIKRHFGKRDDWTELLSGHRLCLAEKEYREQCERNSDVDLLLCTQFCDKRDILIKSFEFAIGKRKLKANLKAIERGARRRGSRQQLRHELRAGGELCRQVNSLAR